MSREDREYIARLGARCEYCLVQAERCRRNGASHLAADWERNARHDAADAFAVAERFA